MASTLGISIPVAPNITALGTTALQNTLNLRAQMYPEGFVADVTLDRTRPLDPLDVYVNAITEVKTLALTLAWTYDVFGRTESNERGTNVNLMFRSVVTRRRAKYNFQVGHAILGIYKAVNMMAKEVAFCNAEVTVSLHGQRVGLITITKRLYAPEMIAGNLTRDESRVANEGKEWEKIASPTAGIGTPAIFEKRTNPYGFPEIIDPLDPTFKISYNFNGPAIPRDNILSAMLDAMVTIARHGPMPRCESLDAQGILGSNVMIHVSPFPQAQNPISYGSVERALTLVWGNLMRARNEWAELSFEIWFREMPFAMGFVGNIRRGEDNLAVESA